MLQPHAAGQHSNCSSNLMGIFLLALPIILVFSLACCSRHPAGVLLLCRHRVLAVLFAIFLVPETRQVPIEEIEELVVHKHW